MCETHFPYLIQNYQDGGHVDDNNFEELGFPVDVD